MTRASNPVRPVHDTWAWRLHALCRSMDPYLFFAPEDEPKGPRVRREREAKRICLRCPVLDQCREYALSTREGYGVWGGTSELDRRTAFRDHPCTANRLRSLPCPSVMSSPSPSHRTSPPRH
ncbi:WhiB family transcriptional regulator [Rhodococcus sp. NPDC059968]|uniref:WhiB family transcriptional regulator n=1 Tax=Rhodococcus sp. NPDC059968 TaxID=3347017 RepID=UPI003671B65F